MSESTESALREINEELQAIYEGSDEGILVVDALNRRFIRANQAMCDLLGYTKDELLAFSVGDIHPPSYSSVLAEMCDAVSQSHVKTIYNIPCLRKDGSVLYANITGRYLARDDHPLVIGFFHDVTEQKRTVDLLRASEDRYRLIAENVGDIIWTADLTVTEDEKKAAQGNVGALVDTIINKWHFSYVTPSVERVFGTTAEEFLQQSLADITMPSSLHRIRQAMCEAFAKNPSFERDLHRPHVLEVEFRAKDGTSRWGEVTTTYLLDGNGEPECLLGITRDVSERRRTERALRESESKLRMIFENLPDLLLTVNRNGTILFANRGSTNVSRKMLMGADGYGFIAPEYREVSNKVFNGVMADGCPQSLDFLDIFGRWWSCRVVSLADQGQHDYAMVICTDITQERLAAETINKEQQLLRRLLELHERERRLTAYDIHDGFAQQLTGALFRLQGFREMHGRIPEEAWKNFDTAVQLISRAIDETRRLISGLRPPILDESGIIQAIEYLVYENSRQNSPDIEFKHKVAFDRLAPPLESAIFRIVQESLQNACRHSKSDKVRVELKQKGERIHIDVIDWGVGFKPEEVEERRFGLQGIRERARLLDGRVVIDSKPGHGTRVAVELPLIDTHGDITDMEQSG